MGFPQDCRDNFQSAYLGANPQQRHSESEQENIEQVINFAGSTIEALKPICLTVYEFSNGESLERL